jgi:CheY-like chemotaxis protein
MSAPSQFRILVVDDDHYTSDVVSVILRQSGFRVVTFYDPLLAMKDALQSAPDVLVTDFSTPGMNGLEFATAMKQHYPSCGVVIVSAEVTAVLKQISSGLTFTLLPKPIDPATLISSVNTWSSQAA